MKLLLGTCLCLASCTTWRLAFEEHRVDYGADRKVVGYINGTANAFTIATARGGLILVDTKMMVGAYHLSANLADRQPLKAIVITHAHRDHLGGLDLFVHDSKPVDVYGAALLSRLALPPGTRLKTVSALEHPDLIIDGTRIRLLAFDHAHTAGDLAVFLPEENILLAGDLVQCGFYPHAERQQGGSYHGLRLAVETLLELQQDKAAATRDEIIIGGHGEACDRQWLVGYVDYLRQMDHGIPPNRTYHDLWVPFETVGSYERNRACFAAERADQGWTDQPALAPWSPWLDRDITHCPAASDAPVYEKEPGPLDPPAR